jgi:hypothetical protein
LCEVEYRCPVGDGPDEAGSNCLLEGCLRGHGTGGKELVGLQLALDQIGHRGGVIGQVPLRHRQHHGRGAACLVSLASVMGSGANFVAEVTAGDG